MLVKTRTSECCASCNISSHPDWQIQGDRTQVSRARAHDTYLDSDHDFGKIEVAVKKRENIFTVHEYHAIIVSAFNKPTASVTRMADKLFDVSNLDKTLHLSKTMYNHAGEKTAMRDRVR